MGKADISIDLICRRLKDILELLENIQSLSHFVYYLFMFAKLIV